MVCDMCVAIIFFIFLHPHHCAVIGVVIAVVVVIVVGRIRAGIGVVFVTR